MNLMTPGVLWCLIFTENVSLRRSVCSPSHPFFFGTFWLQLVPLGCRCHHIGSCSWTCNASRPWEKSKSKIEKQAISGLMRGQTVVAGRVGSVRVESCGSLCKSCSNLTPRPAHSLDGLLRLQSGRAVCATGASGSSSQKCPFSSLTLFRVYFRCLMGSFVCWWPTCTQRSAFACIPLFSLYFGRKEIRVVWCLHVWVPLLSAYVRWLNRHRGGNVCLSVCLSMCICQSLWLLDWWTMMEGRRGEWGEARWKERRGKAADLGDEAACALSLCLQLSYMSMPSQ